ncbi:MAG: hypothetical protein E7047_10645 [Lentisphaerae bacterium]|nr:hypothetical protein [Lentisphaerota bacterium]
MRNFTLKDAVFSALALTLLAVTVPLAATNARENAKLTQCTNKLRMIGAAELTYAADNKSELAMGENNFIKGGGAVRAATYSMGTPPMMLINKKYLQSSKPNAAPADVREEFFRCPEDDVNFVKTPITGWGKPVPAISYLYCWFSTQQGLKSHSYPCKTKPDQDDDYGLRSNIDRDDPDRFIFADLIRATSYRWANVPKDKARSNHGDQYNVLFIGGHVSTKSINEKQEAWVMDGTNRFARLADDVQ